MLGARSLAFALSLALASQVAADPVTITPVGNPVPGDGPVGIAVAETRAGTYVVVADHIGNRVRSFSIDRRTGALTPRGSAEVQGGPSDLAVSRAGRYVVVSSLRSNQVSVYDIDPTTGALSRVGPPVPSGGQGPLGLDINDEGFVVVANQDSDTLGVLQLDRRTGALTTVGTHPVGTGPAKVRMAGNRVVVGTAVSNEVHLLHLDRYGSLLPVDSQPVGAPVFSLALRGDFAAAGTFPDGDLHSFRVGPRGGLIPVGASPTGGDITDLAFTRDGLLMATGTTPPRVTAFEVTRQGGLRERGELAMTGNALRKMVTVRGRGRTSYVVLNEYQNNQTVVLEVR